MLTDVLPYLRCPVCGDELTAAERALRCPAGHAFDVARQGYAGLLTGARTAQRGHTADTAAMVAARAEFLDGGHFASLTELIATRAAARAPEGGCVLDAGSGTGHHLAAVLDRLSDRPGVALDTSKYALRRAARAHPRIGALTWDVWRPLPIRTGTVGVLLDVFAPRNGPEFRRVLRPDGVLIVVTPAPRHLDELVGPLELLAVDPRKDERITETLGEWFSTAGTWPLEIPMRLTHAEVASLVSMGPSAWHTDPARLQERISALVAPIRVSAAFEVRVFDARPES